MLDLEPATREVCRLLAGVRDAQLGDPTPCEDYCVAALLDHIAGLAVAFDAATLGRYERLLAGPASG